MIQEQAPEPIGGYFELELPRFKEYHQGAVALNSGRFCLEYILRCRKYSKVYVPYFTCDTVLDAVMKLDMKHEFYHIDREYRIADDIDLKKEEALIYTNYWGLQGDYCRELAQRYGRSLILDYTQSFYAIPMEGIDTFYSCRKFFGVPDGGYLYTDAKADFHIGQDCSYTRMDSLIKRMDLSAEEGYADFRRISVSFRDMPVRRMSRLTKRMMEGIDYEGAAQRRRENYAFLQRALGGRVLKDEEVPMIFPYETADGQELRERLIRNRIYVARYWPNVIQWAEKDSEEVRISDNIIPLPIDQRYGKEDMARIIRIVTNG